jgi:hypothetical protein
MHTFLYMLLYYGITPTTFDYNVLMEIPREYFGLVSAFTPFIACLSCFTHNYFTAKHYKASFLVSLGCLVVGSFLYCLAFTLRNVAMLFISRALFGYGGARIIIRKFVTKEIHIDHRTKWSLIDSPAARGVKLNNFDKLTAAEKEAIMDALTGFKIAGMRFSKVNYVVFVLFFFFVIMFFAFLFYFQDTAPKGEEVSQNDKNRQETPAATTSFEVSQIENLHLLPSDNKSPQYSSDDKMKKLNDFKLKLTSVTKYFTDTQTAYIGVVLFVSKAVQECIIVESPSYIIRNYKYNSGLSGLLFFIFTLVTMPASLIPSLLKTKFEDRAMLRLASYLLLAAMVIKSQFTEALYPFWLFVAGSCLVLAISLTVETSSSSILTKVISEKRAKTFMNAGIWGGIIDTLGRATGSSSITIITLFADYAILNCILYPFWLAVFAGLTLGLIGMYSRLDIKTYVKFQQHLQR